MENATKALLIAAAVLIAIILIALGVRLLGSAGDASSQANNVASQINQSLTHQTGVINSSLSQFKK